jgi:DNA polymerase delta subunit 1
MDLNPDIVIGYNIWGFDIEYIWNRSIELGINNKFQIGLGKICRRKSILKEQKLSSSALGDNIFNLLDVDGIVMIDLLKVIQKDFKLDSYKLDNVASIYIGDKKDDLKPKEIFEKFLGDSKDRSVIAKYCIQDCILVNRLLHKLKILENNIGMGNVCLVPLNFLFRRGQGIKIFSLVANECMKMDYLIPVIKNFIEDLDIDGYEGAIVLPPKEAIYLDDPIVVFDYGSLYPSSMICRNLSHDTYITDEKYLIENDEYEIIKVSYDLYQGVGDKKTKNGVKDCYFAKYKDGKKGIIPDILDMLLTERKNTRKKIEYSTIILKDGNELIGIIDEKDDMITITDIDKKTKVRKDEIVEIKNTYNKFECAVFDALQNAYKITANSLYGQIGARTSPIYLKEIAACTTSTGREMILLAKDFVEKHYNADVI